MKTLLLLPFFISLVACNATKTVTEVSSGGVAGPNTPNIWVNDSWPKTLHISEDFDTDEIANIKAMSAAWKDALDDHEFFTIPNTLVSDKSNVVTNATSLNDSQFAVYKTTKWPKSMGLALAVTQLFGTLYNEGDPDEYLSVVHADILVNYKDYSFRFNDSYIDDHYDLRTVMLHEMGHFIGLGHRSKSSNRNNSVMYPSIFDSENKTYPKQIDINEIAERYDIPVAGSSNPAIVAQKKVYKPRTPGKEIRILIELHPNGDCIHKRDGVVFERHAAKLR